MRRAGWRESKSPVRMTDVRAKVSSSSESDGTSMKVEGGRRLVILEGEATLGEANWGTVGGVNLGR